MGNVIHHSCLQAFSTIRCLFLWGAKFSPSLWASCCCGGRNEVSRSPQQNLRFLSKKKIALPSCFLPAPKTSTLDHRPECQCPSLVLLQGPVLLPSAELGNLLSFPLTNHSGDVLALQGCSFSFLSIYLLSSISWGYDSHHRYSMEVNDGGIRGVSKAELLSTWKSRRSTSLG